jgi:MATE family multidrug resistance protein
MTIPSALKQIAILSGPIILGQVSQTLIGAGDVYVASLHSTDTVASVGVAVGIMNPILLFGIGLTMGISALFSIKRGAGEAVKGKVSTVLAYSLAIGLILTLALWGVQLLIPYFGIQAPLVKPIQTYLSIIAWSIPPLIVFQGLKEYMQAFERVLAPNLLSIAAVIFNVIINYVLVFGWGPINGMGEIGLPIASVIVRVLLCLGLLGYLLLTEKWSFPEIRLPQELFKFSLPIASAFFLEILAFCLVSVLSGTLGVQEAAANNIILTLASTLFMVPLSLSSAASVKIGNAFGLQSRLAVKTYIQAVFVFTLSYSLFSSSLLAAAPHSLMSFFSNDPEVILLGVRVCYIVAIFQFFDCLQVTCSGVLRGLKETRFPLLMVVLAFWLIGIPTGTYLTYQLDFGIRGLWIGLALGLAVASIGLGFLLRRRYMRIWQSH